MKDKKAMKLQAAEFAHQIRDFCRSQVEQWRQVPWLAAETYGRAGCDPRHMVACVSGLWLIEIPTASTPVLAYVDLLTGNVVDYERFHNHAVMINLPDEATLPLAFVLDSLDASSVLHDLRRAADRPYAKGTDPERAAAFRDHIRTMYKIKPVYDEKALRRIE